MPTLKKARGNARLSVCVNNMKQISTGILMYTMSNDGTPYHTYRSIQDDLADQNILTLDSGAWECPEDMGTWTYNSQNAPMDQHGKTTFEAQEKSYLVNGQYNNMFELKDEGDPSQGETNDSKDNIRNISIIEEPSLYRWSSCAPLRGNYGDNEGTKKFGYYKSLAYGLNKMADEFCRWTRIDHF